MEGVAVVRCECAQRRSMNQCNLLGVAMPSTEFLPLGTSASRRCRRCVNRRYRHRPPVISGPRLSPTPPTTRTDHALGPPFARRIWCLHVLVNVHGRFARCLTLTHAQSHLRSTYLLIDSVGDLLHFDKRRDSFEERVVGQ